MTPLLRLLRSPSVDGATMGVLFLNGHFECFTVEDQNRQPKHESPTANTVAAWKVPGKTAIPAGRYKVRVTRSPKFGKKTPELFDVPGFSNIRLHWGNSADDTEGCLIVGKVHARNQVYESRIAYEALMAKLAGLDEFEIDIENPKEG